uniref:Uncharacterized protein n=1 Tax=Kalanchoe fedtschenkoi TaxID=63787 RepID=A0A7N0V6X5_KALFE
MEQQISEAAAAAGYDESQCRMCGKRQSPSSCHLGISSNSEMEPRTKKPMLHNHQLDPESAALSGYAELKLPIRFNTVMNLSPTSGSPLLRRCVSDPYNSPGDGITNNNNAVSLEFDGPLRRCVSDPYHPPGAMTKNQAGAAGGSPTPAGGLPPLYPGSNRQSATDVTVTPPKVAADSFKGQSPDSLRLQRMRERMKEMARWWDDVVRLEDDETPEEQNHNNAAASQDVSDKEVEELVSVEKSGDGLKIKLRCPCGSGYEILITGQTCYYKLL